MPTCMEHLSLHCSNFTSCNAAPGKVAHAQPVTTLSGAIQREYSTNKAQAHQPRGLDMQASPGTSVLASTVLRWPPRTTTAVGDNIALIASAACRTNQQQCIAYYMLVWC